MLGQIAQSSSGLHGISVYGNATDTHAARIRLQIARNHFEGGGFPGTIGPQKSHDLTFPDFEGNVIHGALRSVGFREVADFDGHDAKLVLRKLTRTFRQMIILTFPGEPSKQEQSECDGNENNNEDGPLDPGIHGGIAGDFLMGGGGQHPDGGRCEGHPYPSGQSFECIHEKFV